LSETAALLLQRPWAKALKNHRDFYEATVFGVQSDSADLSFGDNTSLDFFLTSTFNHGAALSTAVFPLALMAARWRNSTISVFRRLKTFNEKRPAANLFRATLQHSFSDVTESQPDAFFTATTKSCIRKTSICLRL